MNKLTREEIQEVNDLLFNWLDDFDASDFKEILGYLEQKKKQWQEEAVNEYIDWYRKELAMDWKLKIGDDGRESVIDLNN